ncbi:MAG TPA: hypothetical protein VGO14_08475 [Solirubrobacteraceae bacterium]|nr:hypothetical protein [Solirubrobacteraceae bacterium]
MKPSTGQSTWIATLIVLFVAAIVITALSVYKVDDFLKVWAVIGTLVGVVTGAIPGFFFAATAQRTAKSVSENKAASDEKLQTLLGFSSPDALRAAVEARPDLFAGPGTRNPGPGTPTSE